MRALARSRELGARFCFLVLGIRNLLESGRRASCEYGVRGPRLAPWFSPRARRATRPDPACNAGDVRSACEALRSSFLTHSLYANRISSLARMCLRAKFTLDGPRLRPFSAFGICSVVDAAFGAMQLSAPGAPSPPISVLRCASQRLLRLPQVASATKFLFGIFALILPFSS